MSKGRELCDLISEGGGWHGRGLSSLDQVQEGELVHPANPRGRLYIGLLLEDKHGSFL